MVLTEEERKERKREYIREWRLKNKDKIKEQRKEYRQTNQGIKSRIISLWKFIGVIHEDFDKLYEYYINTNECNICKGGFTDKNKKCLDHDHTNGLFRQILCNSCNIRDNWKLR